MKLNFLDLFAGAGGLSEGFIQAGYTPIAHVEMDKAACYTLRTRTAFHELEKTAEGRATYSQYLNGEIDRQKLYELISQHTRNYAKRQLTFLRGLQYVKYFDKTEKGYKENIQKEIENWIKNIN